METLGLVRLRGPVLGRKRQDLVDDVSLIERVRARLVVRVEAETLEKLKTVLSDSIRTIENVRSTLTMIVVD